MTRTLTITVNEWESVRDGHLWIVRPGLCPHKVLPCGGADCCCAHEPPYDLLAAAAPCETCGNRRQVNAPERVRAWRPCPDCRITLVGECPCCKGNPAKYRDVCGGVVVLGYAYPASEVMPIVQVGDGHGTVGRYVAVGHLGCRMVMSKIYERFPVGLADITDDLAHYGDPAGLVGKWALQLAVQP